MNRLRLCLALICLFAPATAPGGAWPRGEGLGFASVTTRITDGTLPTAPRVRHSVYLAYGLTERIGLTVEVDLAGGRVPKALGLYTLSLLPRDHPWKLSLALGGGTLNGTPAISPRFTLGRGFTVFGTAGWAEAALAGEFTRAAGGQAGKLDLTLGLSPTPRLRSYVQVFAYQSFAGPRFIRAETSLAYRVHRRVWFDVGVSTGITPVRDHRLKLGVWTAF
ncbi:hypothetical protein [Pseudooceanicola sp.]|uniref:hypothetical protein n=1 Tax=Pseudooceanicola sp. TaxID=1914328 RepID=UPI00405A183B